MNGREAGMVSVNSDPACEVAGNLFADAGEYELVLRFDDASGLEILEVTLY